MVKLFVFWLLLIGVIEIAEARIRRYKWEVKYEYKSPDCMKKLSMTINGRTPGPSITAQQGDTIIVELTNSLGTENVAVHWHGIRQVRYCISHLKETQMCRRVRFCFDGHN